MGPYADRYAEMQWAETPPTNKCAYLVWEAAPVVHKNFWNPLNRGDNTEMQWGETPPKMSFEPKKLMQAVFWGAQNFVVNIHVFTFFVLHMLFAEDVSWKVFFSLLQSFIHTECVNIMEDYTPLFYLP